MLRCATPRVPESAIGVNEMKWHARFCCALIIGCFLVTGCEEQVRQGSSPSTSERSNVQPATAGASAPKTIGQDLSASTDKPETERAKEGLFGAEVGAHHAGVYGIGSDTGALKTASQLFRLCG